LVVLVVLVVLLLVVLLLLLWSFCDHSVRQMRIRCASDTHIGCTPDARQHR
jgi:hypothetical protein